MEFVSSPTVCDNIVIQKCYFLIVALKKKETNNNIGPSRGVPQFPNAICIRWNRLIANSTNLYAWLLTHQLYVLLHLVLPLPDQYPVATSILFGFLSTFPVPSAIIKAFRSVTADSWYSPWDQLGHLDQGNRGYQGLPKEKTQKQSQGYGCNNNI